MRPIWLFAPCLVFYVSQASAETWQVTDLVKFSSEAVVLGSSKPLGATTTKVSRSLTSPTADGAPWFVEYQEMSINESPLAGIQGRLYSVQIQGGSLVVAPVAPTDADGLAGVQADLETLQPILASRSMDCPAGAELCPGLVSFLQRIGKASILAPSPERGLAVEVTPGTGAKLRGIAEFEPERWVVILEGRRTEKIRFAVETDSQEAAAEVVDHYSLIRNFKKQ
jgi:hypothetical protein